tara:strand:- start:4873 stop:6831 length:1959 start_codon:yes stop_codon:yes gene_type:complete
VIEIVGHEGSAEYAAALAIRQALASLWPGLEETPAEEDHVRIAANAKLSGFKVSDVDVIVVGRLRPGRYFVPSRAVKDSDGNVVNEKIEVRSFAVAIEEKSHDPSGVRIAGDAVTVRYTKNGRTEWKSATDQNVDQVHAVQGYLANGGAKSVWVYRALVMSGLDRVRSAVALSRGFTGRDFFTALVSVNGPRHLGRGYVVSSFRGDEAEIALGASVFEETVPTGLDRKRMDRIAARSELASRLAGEIGTKRVHLRGHGGTGKTVLLLQAAFSAYEEYDKRVLVLTYNHALAADIQRLLAMMHVPSGPGGGGIEVRTVMSFTYSWLGKLGLLADEEELSGERYRELCEEALEYIASGTIGPADIESIKDENWNEFEYDAILVDEAQDWPQAEAGLLCSCFGADKVSLADGREQYVRGEPTNWKRGVTKAEELELVPLQRALRMKSNLARFANAVAETSGLRWSVEDNDKAGGGEVIISLRPYAETPDLWKKVFESGRSRGNKKLDLLHCVPPSTVSGADNPRSRLADAFRAAGEQAWDGVSPFVRRDFPRSVDCLRVVQYQSCRGLEGWVTVLDGLDEFWEAKRVERLRIHPGPDAGGRSAEELAGEFAWRWVMIALTRPIDTLVITLRDPGSIPGKVIMSVAGRHRDFAREV